MDAPVELQVADQHQDVGRDAPPGLRLRQERPGLAHLAEGMGAIAVHGEGLAGPHEVRDPGA
jgi:hypothetical protein